jgi:endonuclease/exonuclease/phosphatase family metal-dependent hydrolase
LIVCGDFNVLPESRLFEALAGLGLKDLVTTRGFHDTRTSHYAKPVRFADYLLVSDEVAVLSFDVVESPEVSDHRPLLLTTG